MIGLVALVVAAIRRRTGGAGAVFWLGVWSFIYGIQSVSDCSFLVALLPHWMQVCVPYLHVSVTYLVLVAGLLTFRELAVGRLRQFTTLLPHRPSRRHFRHWPFCIDRRGVTRLFGLNNFVATFGLVVLLVFFLVPSLSRKYSLIANRRVMLAGATIFAWRPSSPTSSGLWAIRYTPSGATLDSSFLSSRSAMSPRSRCTPASSACRRSRKRARHRPPVAVRDLAHNNATTPQPAHRPAYEPMTAVAGDFYEYLQVDDYRAGFLVADVSGHGVPAALIASMIKVAVQSVAEFAYDPSQLLRRLRDILSAQLQGQFVSAAYLWIDCEARTARYSAAGHPPLLCWRAADRMFERIESNGQLFEVLPFDGDYPVCEIPFVAGDRFLLYTDGVSEPENAAGEAFGDHRLEQLAA